MRLSEIVIPGAVVASLASAERDEVIIELVDALVRAGSVGKKLRDEVVRLALEREQRASTGFGKGVAVPHVKLDSADSVCLAIGLSQSGVDFNSLDKQPVYSVFLLVSPADKPDEHLKAMEVIFKNLQYDTFRRFLRQASSPSEVLELLNDADSQQIPG